MRQIACTLFVALCVLVALPTTASAASGSKTGYVCKVRYLPSASGTYGDYGYIWFHMTASPGCIGGSLGSYGLFSAGCGYSANESYCYDPAILASHHRALERAVYESNSIRVYWEDTNGTTQAKYIEFRAY